jgi:hypothetical protein
VDLRTLLIRCQAWFSRSIVTGRGAPLFVDPEFNEGTWPHRALEQKSRLHRTPGLFIRVGKAHIHRKPYRKERD